MTLLFFFSLSLFCRCGADARVRSAAIRQAAQLFSADADLAVEIEAFARWERLTPDTYTHTPYTHR